LVRLRSGGLESRIGSRASGPRLARLQLAGGPHLVQRLHEASAGEIVDGIGKVSEDDQSMARDS
jgi:hypothetical protein